MIDGNPAAPNLLSRDGELYYFRGFLDGENADRFFRILFADIEWKHDEVIMFGKKIITKRKYAWFGDRPFSYKYSNTLKVASVWTPELVELKKCVENFTGEEFNSCLLNLYHSGEEGMAWHSDNEKELKKNGAIASVSLGAERKFVCKQKETGEKTEQILEHGSLLLMKGSIQTHWLHSLPKSRKVTEPRINLTFRTIVP